MKYRDMNKFLLVCFAFCAFTACTDDLPITNDTPNSIENIFYDGYSLNFVATLDNMGEMATRATAWVNPSTPQDVVDMENYVDPEKFRVLFFECKPKDLNVPNDYNHDYFLFESKSRWVKKLDGNENRWLVSVPLFTYGNDYYEDKDGNKTLEWDWERIRTALTTNRFKIAILANRPEYDWYPGFEYSGLEKDPRWMDNTGPHWGPNDTGVKDVFDLHHCQYDAVYHGKSEEYGYYDFIMGDYDLDENGGVAGTYKDQRPQMGATSSWVNWLGGNKHGWDRKTARHPSKDYPIPMYGIQEFEPITAEYNWRKGTPFNLSVDIPGDKLDENHKTKYTKKSISLLRSVVKVELLIPTRANNVNISKPTYVGLSYVNIYARCEPMDVWTPTDELWEKQHNLKSSNGKTRCEFDNIINYGPIALDGASGYDDKLSNTTDGISENDKFVSKRLYQKKLSWLYGIWKEKGWDKTSPLFGSVNIPDGSENSRTPYPRIFNPCIQRNSFVLCDEEGDLTNKYNDGYYHYVAYVGERNLNDPSQLGNIASEKGGHPTVMYWLFVIGDNLYGLPITDYRNSNNPVRQGQIPETGYLSKNSEIVKTGFMNGEQSPLGTPNTHYGNDEKRGYMQRVMKLRGTDTDLLPWPLLRNHVYRLTLTTKNDNSLPDPNQSTRGGEDDATMFEIKMDDFHSESLRID